MNLRVLVAGGECGGEEKVYTYMEEFCEKFNKKMLKKKIIERKEMGS